MDSSGSTIYETDSPARKQLGWILRIILAPFWDEPLGYHLLSALKHPTGFGGDPGWELTFFRKDGVICVEVWTNSEVSGFEDTTTCTWQDLLYVANTVLNEVAEQYPERQKEAQILIQKLASGILVPVGI